MVDWRETEDYIDSSNSMSECSVKTEVLTAGTDMRTGMNTK